jgi:hypothetical protein
MFRELHAAEVDVPAEFQLFLDIVHKLPQLATLNIRRWPSAREVLGEPFELAQRRMAPTKRCRSPL